MTVIDAHMVFAPGLLPQIVAVAARYPSLHLALAQYPNVAVKATSLPTYVTEAYPYPITHAHIPRVVEAYGPHRVFWGTDLTRLRGSYRQAVTLFAEELDFLSDIDKT